MAKYELPQYQSMYVDPQSVAINTELRSRFIESFQGDDALASAVDGMQAADFEGDQARKQELTDIYNTQLDERAARGDYETLGMAIAKDARSFVKDYNPLINNKQRYDAWGKTVKEMEELGDEKGGITSITAQLARAEAKHNYLGLQYDDNGNFIEDSYFSGSNLVKDVNLEKRMQEEIKDVVAREYSRTQEEPLGDIQIGPDGKPIITTTRGANGEVKYWRTTKRGVEEISPNLVKVATDRVLKHDDVQASLSQKARLQNFQLDAIGDGGQMQVTNKLDAAEVEIEEKMAELEAEGLEKEDKNGVTNETKINELEGRLNSIKEARIQQGDMSTMNNLTKQEMMQNFQNSNVSKYAYANTVYEETYDADAHANSKKEMDKSTQTVSSITKAAVTPALGGITNTEKREFVKNSEIAYNSGVREIITIGGGQLTDEGVTTLMQEIDDIDNFSDESLQDMASKYGYGDDVELFRNKVTDIITIKQKRDLVQQKIRETEDALQKSGVIKSDEEISAEFSGSPRSVREGKATSTIFDRTGGNVTGINLRDAMITVGLLDKNASVKDAMDYWFLKDPTGRSYKVLQNKELMQVLFEQNADTFKEGVTDEMKMAGIANLVNLHIGNYTQLRRETDKKLDVIYNEEIKADLGWNMNWWGNKEVTADIQKAWENKFATNAIWANLNIIHPETGKTVNSATYFKDMKLWTTVNADDIKVDTKNIGLMSVSRADGVAMLAVPIIDKDGNAHTLMVPANQFKNEAMDSWINSAEYMATRMWNDGVHAKLPGQRYAPNLFDGKIVFDYSNKSNPIIYIDNKPLSKKKGLAFIATKLHANKLATLHSGGDSVDETAFAWMGEQQ